MMIQKKKIAVLIIIFTLTTFLSVYAYEAFQGSTELIQYDPAKAYNGYTLFSPFRGDNTYLIDMYGDVVHMWAYPKGWSIPGIEAVEKHARLLEDGTLLRGHINRAAGEDGATYMIYDWNGNIIWQYKDPRTDHVAHHDFRMIWNKKLKERTLMYVSSRNLSHEEALKLGCDPKIRDNYKSNPDGLVEVDMDGNVIWEWNISDHLIQDFNANADNYVGKGRTISDYPGRLDPNFGSGRSGDWIHINSFDYNEELDHVVINNSIDSEFYVIDHSETFVPGDPKKSIELAASRAGDFIFRWGNPCTYDSGECPSMKNEGSVAMNGHQQVFFTHDIQWIREKEIKSTNWALPGAGHFLIFNNGSRQPGVTHSSVLEINPYEGDWKEGVYIPEVQAGYTEEGGSGVPGSSVQLESKQIVWKFKSTLSNAFFGSYISGCQRLPNGNTLVDSGPHGHFFEVTEEGEVVWEYINPVGDRTKGEYGIYKIMDDRAGQFFNSAFRCVRYAPDYPGLKGRDLNPQGKITEIHSKEPERAPKVGPMDPRSMGRKEDPNRAP
jgi:hypothetical protein